MSNFPVKPNYKVSFEGNLEKSSFLYGGFQCITIIYHSSH